MSARERCEAVATAEEVMRLVDELREGGYRRELGCPQRVGGRYGIEAVDEARRLYRLTWWQKREPKRRRRPREGVAR